MYTKNIFKSVLILSIVFITTLLSSNTALAHCDSMNGPVIKAAQKALETGNVNLVLVWVQKADEATIKQAFEKTLAVRKQSKEARELADMYFFETLVRIHRAGEGAAYTGLKSADYQPEPGIAAADNAVEKGDAKALVNNLSETIHQGLHKRFMHVKETKNYNGNNIEAGREFVKAYVTFIHYVEGIYVAAEKTDGHHGEEKEVVPHID